MPLDSGDATEPFIKKVEARDGSRVAIAGTIHNVYLGSEPAYTAFDLFSGVPSLPANFISRPELTTPLIEDLLANTSIPRPIALEGMGGVGKSLLALSLCDEARVREAFPDGIVWLTVGRRSGISLAHGMERIATLLNHKFRAYTEFAYRSLLRQKAVLIVLDDIWSVDDAEPFLPPAGRSRLLYTSRTRDVAGSLGADNYEVGLLDSVQARRFLLRWSRRESEPPEELFIVDILEECSGLVLALAMVGSALRGQDDKEWAFVASQLRKGRLKEVGTRPGGYEHQTLHASIAISVDSLDPAARQRYLQLAVLRKGMVAPEPILQDLWGGDPDEVHRLARHLVDRSLAGRTREGSLGLHDLQLD